MTETDEQRVARLAREAAKRAADAERLREAMERQGGGSSG